MNTIVLQKSYNYYCFAADLTNAFSKKYRHSLGLKIDNLNLDLIAEIITAEQSVEVLKEASLLKACVKAETAKLLWRMAMEKRLIKETNYFKGANNLIEICKMLNGWRKSLIK